MLRKSVIHIISLSWLLLGISMAISSLWSIYYSENDFIPIIYASSITIFFGLVVSLFTKSNKIDDLSVRDGFAIVTFGWISLALFSALPFYLSGYNFSYTDSFFEAMSGLTTTGASILGKDSIEIESITHGLLFWRSFTQFIGGMGIIVFSIAILPMLGFGGVQLFRAEVAGLDTDQLKPRIKQTAKLLWVIYVSFICLLTTILLLTGEMNLFHSLCHAFTTIGTAGFSTRNESIGAFSPLVQWIIVIFMFIAATNFSLHYTSIKKRKFEYFRDTEFKIYFIVIIFLSIVFSVNIFNYYGSDIFSTIRYSVFTTVSLVTTTGFANVDYGIWPSSTKVLIFFLFFLGGCAGSTTGGIKILRTILVGKVLVCELKKLVHPKGVFSIKIGESNISDNIVKNTLGFYLFYIFIFITASIIFSLTGLDIVTSLSASASAIGNIGPGLGLIGPANSWANIDDVGKWVASFCMLLGRLEIFTVMVLFSKTFWVK